MLRKYVCEAAISDDSVRSDRQWMANHDMFVIGMEDMRHGTLVFIKDTSGSISNDILRNCVSVLQQACDELNANRIVVIDADAQVCDVQEYGPHDSIPLVAKGRGGTDFRPAIKYVEDNIQDARIMIYLTDGYGDFPAEEPSVPVLWITYGLEEPQFPFGEVINLSDLLNKTV